MRGMFHTLFCLGLICCVAPPCLAIEPAVGWRGNGTGLWPDCTAPTHWRRIAHGAMEGMRGQANRPTTSDAGKRTADAQGLAGPAAHAGPIRVNDSVQDLDRDLVGGEVSLSPAEGDRNADHTWKRISAKQDDPMEFGAAVLPWVELVTPADFAQNRIYYAQTNVYSPRGGQIVGVIEHCFGLKAWVNGKEVYRAAGREAPLATYEQISRQELSTPRTPLDVLTPS